MPNENVHSGYMEKSLPPGIQSQWTFDHMNLRCRRKAETWGLDTSPETGLLKLCQDFKVDLDRIQQRGSHTFRTPLWNQSSSRWIGQVAFTALPLSYSQYTGRESSTCRGGWERHYTSAEQRSHSGSIPYQKATVKEAEEPSYCCNTACPRLLMFGVRVVPVFACLCPNEKEA